MSDRIEQVSRCYRENVSPEEHPILTGQRPSQDRSSVQGMWSAAVGVVITSLRYIAPAVFAIFWGQQSLLYRLIKHVETTFKSIIYSSDAQRESVLQWLAASGSVRVENMETVWQHGWLVCGAIDAVVPGACAGHPPSRLSLEHAQTIAETHLGVEPVFSHQELENSESLDQHQEWKLVHYLDRVRLALAKLSPPATKQNSPCKLPENQINVDYVAKGSGLTAAQLNQKSYFRVYPSEQQSLEPGEITIIIKGPNKMYGMSNGPPILGKAHAIRQKVLGLEEKFKYTENVLPLTQGATYLRNYGKNDMNKTYYIPKEKHEIDIDVQIRQDHLKIGYVVKIEGKYEISITSRGLHIVGSPFTVTATKDIIKILEKQNNFLEDGETISVFDEKSDRKVVLRIVDFVTEKMLLKENGTLEKISEDEANTLIYSDVETDICKNFATLSKCIKDEATDQNFDKTSNKNRFKDASTKVSKILSVCKIFNSTLNEKTIHNSSKGYPLSCSQKAIPDIVNSTLNETSKPLSHLNDTTKTNEQEEKVHNLLEIYDEIEFNNTQDCISNKMNIERDIINNSEKNHFSPKSPAVYDKDSSTNPFLKDFSLEKENNFDLNNSKEPINRINTLTSDPIHIFINEEINVSPSNTNPFLDVNVEELERPKTPILKIITGDIKDRHDSIYINPERNDNLNAMQEDELMNPFILSEQHKSQVEQEDFPIIDFIIGAPVSLPPILKAPSPEPNNINSMFLTALQHETENQKANETDYTCTIENTTLASNKNSNKTKKENINSTYETESHYDPSSVGKYQEFISTGQTSNFEYERETKEDSSDGAEIYETSNKDVEITNKELWDSAYVSIDDNNSTPDTNNNNFGVAHSDVYETQKEQKHFYTVFSEHENSRISAHPKMDSAERDTWKTYEDLSVIPRTNDLKSDSKNYRNLRPIFTPIIEENERSTSSVNVETHENDITNDGSNIDPVSVAFAELNEVFKKYCPESEPNSLTSVTDKEKFDSIVINHAVESRGHVDPASVNADVERQESTNLEGTISGVQQNATELDSASRALQLQFDSLEKFIPKINREFGENTGTNIVLEKKIYWDNKIKEIEEMKAQQPKRKKISSKPLKHNDSLTKRKGKQIVKNFLNATESGTPVVKHNHTENMPDAQNDLLSDRTRDPQSSEKLVDKWKKYWDEKLESEILEKQQEQTLEMLRAKSPIRKLTTPQKLTETSDNKTSQIKTEKYLVPPIVPVKQEIAEEVFKAFETSPKRFFGTSRKQILNKIDAFLKKPSSDDKQIRSDEMRHESGIVSSRITLYHQIAKTEPLNANQRDLCLYPSKKEPLQRKLEETMRNGQLQDTDHIIEQKVMNDIIMKRKETGETEISIPETETVVPKRLNSLSKSSVSKSEMDIFNKGCVGSSDKILESHKSCDELPRVNVKNFISLYENASKSSLVTSPVHSSKTSSISSISTSKYQPMKAREVRSISPEMMSQEPSRSIPSSKRVTEKFIDHRFKPIYNIAGIDESELHTEIIDLSIESEHGESESPKRDVFAEYKTRFKLAKEYFQSKEELRQEPQEKTRKLNECEILLRNNSTESEQTTTTTKKTKKKVKSNTFPSSEIAYAWEQFDKGNDESATKLVKISEKFNIDDLFNDIVGEGRLNRQGSFKGIPHKKAVLETFKSMENVSDNKLSPYEIAISQLKEFSKEKTVKNAQTYLTEYPYLPKTARNNYYSRSDSKAFGLISRQELLNSKHRRNSVPDLRLNATFTADL